MISKTNTPCRAQIPAGHANPQLHVLQAALRFAKEGFRIVPCHGIWQGKCTCKRKSCPKPGKHPRIRNWTKQANADSVQIRKWFGQWPVSNLGVATGAESGIVVLDFDGDAGRRSLEELATRCSEVLTTLTHQSGGGGVHLFFRHPGFPVPNSASTLLPGMDVRGDGGLIILPPSTHASRRIYSVANELPISELPASINEMLRHCHKERLGEIKCNDETPREVMQGEEEGETFSLILHSVPPELIASAIHASLPTGPRRRNQQVFELARHLQAIDGLTHDFPVIELRPVVEDWYLKSCEQAKQLGFTIDGDVEESWTDFRYAWTRVRHPVGAALKSVFDLAAEMDAGGEVEPVVWNALLYFRRDSDQSMRLLFSVIYALSDSVADGIFSLACTAAAEQFRRFGCSHVDSKWVLRRLQTLTADGVLQCIDRGRPGTSGKRVPAKYRWTWTPRDPPPVQRY